MKAQFTFHPERCVGCGACVVACINENRLDVDEYQPFRLLKRNEYADGDRVDITYFTHGCMHCPARPCQAACPKDCFSYDGDTGIVLLNPTDCVGCRACWRACPFDAIQFTRQNRAAKCNGCIDRLRGDNSPLCVLACPRRALTIDEKNRVVSEGLDALRGELDEYYRRKEN